MIFNAEKEEFYPIDLEKEIKIYLHNLKIHYVRFFKI